jgi:hypothetical protein
VGPIKSAFSGVVTLTEMEAPNRIGGTVEGDDKSSASSVKATFTGTLKTVEGGTEAAFEVEANLRGRLAQFGGPVINATAKKLTAEFAKNLRRSRAFKFLEPTNLSEAILLLDQYADDAKIIAGGTSVVLMLQQKLIVLCIIWSVSVMISFAIGRWLAYRCVDETRESNVRYCEKILSPLAHTCNVVDVRVRIRRLLAAICPQRLRGRSSSDVNCSRRTCAGSRSRKEA